MNLFLKHLFRSISRKPLQPIILILTLTLSVAISIFSYSLNSLLDEEFSETQSAKFGSADIRVSLSGTSKTRFVFAEDAERLLDGAGCAVGSFDIPMFFGEEKETVFGVAVDFYDVGEIFEIEFLEYGVVTPSTVSDAVFISSEFANEQGVSLGDRVEFEIAGEKKIYTVSGISKRAFLASYDVMVDISGIVRILASDNIILSSMGEGFKPSSTIYIDLNEGIDANECISVLRDSEMFSDKEIKEVTSFIEQQTNNDTMKISLSLAIVFSALLCAAVSFSTLYILSLNRSEENAVFYAAGAQRRQLLLAQYVEVIVCWAIAGVLGFLLSIPILSAFSGAVDFSYITPGINLSGVIKGEGCVLAVALITVSIFAIAGKREGKKSVGIKLNRRMAAVSSLAFCACSLGTTLLPVGVRTVLFTATIASMLLAVYFTVPVFMHDAMSLAERCFEKRLHSGRFSLLYAIKNVRRVKILHNTVLLVELTLSFMLLLVVIILGGFGSVEYSRLALNGEYAVLNATESCSEKVDECESVEAVHPTYLGSADFDNGVSVAVFSAYDKDAFWDGMKVDLVPSDNYAVLSHSSAVMADLDVGDSFTVEISGVEVELVVYHITESTFGYLIFDSDYFGISKNTLITKAKDGYSDSEILGDISGKISLEMASVVSVDALFSEKARNITMFLECGKILIFVLLVFVIIGMLNNLFESYRARREDFALFELAGMKKSEISRMKLYEVLITFSFGILLGSVFAVILIYVSDSTAISYGFSPLGNFLQYIA